MLDTATSILLSLILGSGIILVAFSIKKTYTKRQFLSLFSLGAVLVASGITRVTVAEGDQLTPSQQDNGWVEVGNTVESAFFTEPEKVTVMNADQTKALGSYLTASTSQTDLSKEDLIFFYETIVFESGADWVTLILGDEKGIMFPGSTASFTYGELDEEACVSTILGHGLILGETIEYQSH